MDGEQSRFAVWICPVLRFRVRERGDAHRVFILNDAVPDVRCKDKPFFLLGQLPILFVSFCRITRSLPTSVPAWSVNRLLGSRTTDTILAFFTIWRRTSSFFGEFNTPSEVMNATIPPSRAASRPLRKSSCGCSWRQYAERCPQLPCIRDRTPPRRRTGCWMPPHRKCP